MIFDFYLPNRFLQAFYNAVLFLSNYKHKHIFYKQDNLEDSNHSIILASHNDFINKLQQNTDDSLINYGGV